MTGEEIRRARQILGLSQEELAQKLGIHKNTLWKYENGAIIPKNKHAVLMTVLKSAKRDGDEIYGWLNEELKSIDSKELTKELTELKRECNNQKELISDLQNEIKFIKAMFTSKT